MSSYISFSAVLIYGLSYIHLQNKKDTKRDFATITKDSKILRWDQNFPRSTIFTVPFTAPSIP